MNDKNNNNFCKCPLIIYSFSFQLFCNINCKYDLSQLLEIANTYKKKNNSRIIWGVLIIVNSYISGDLLLSEEWMETVFIDKTQIVSRIHYSFFLSWTIND